MLSKYKLRIVISIVLSAAVFFLANSYLSKLQHKEPIVVAKQKIEQYTKLTPDMLTIVYMNKEDKALFFPNAVQDIKLLDGAITRIKFEKNQPVEKTPETMVFGEDKALALNYQEQVDKAYFIPYEKRVVAVDVDASGGLNFKLNKGDFVDVIYTSIDDSTGGLYSSMILQHIQIFDIEQMTGDKNAAGLSGKKQNVLLLVKPEECMKLAVSKRNGVIDLVLNPLNGTTGNIKPMHLLDFAAVKPVPKSEMLKILEENLKSEDISEPVKKEMLANIEREKSIEAVKSMIEGSKIPGDKKQKLLEMLK